MGTCVMAVIDQFEDALKVHYDQRYSEEASPALLCPDPLWLPKCS